MKGHHKCAYLLLRGGADVSPVASAALHSQTPLHMASELGTPDALVCIEHLLAAGADRNVVDSKGRTPLSFAVIPSNLKAVQLLLEAGTDPNKLNIGGQTALFGATNVEIAKALLAAGASVHVVNIEGWTVLHHAGYHNHPIPIICLLFKAGANPLLKDFEGLTAADHAKARGHEGAAKMLVMLEAKYIELRRLEEEKAKEEKNLSDKVGSLAVKDMKEERK